MTVPKDAGGLDAMAPDGRGGIWLLAQCLFNQRWYRYHARHWTSQAVPWPKGYNSTIFGMAWIPGTTSALAVGEADSNTQTRTIGVAYRYTR